MRPIRERLAILNNPSLFEAAAFRTEALFPQKNSENLRWNMSDPVLATSGE